MTLCLNIDTLAMAFLDDELVPEERRELELHMLGCTSCRAHVDSERSELDMIRSALVAPPTPDVMKARLGRALDQVDVEERLAERRRTRSVIGKWMLPGSAILAAAAAVLVALTSVQTASTTGPAPVANEIMRQSGRAPLEVQGANTGPWLRANFRPIEPMQFRMDNIELLGARLTAVSGHDAAELRYNVRVGRNHYSLGAVMIDDLDLRNEDLGGIPIRIRNRIVHVHEVNRVAVVTLIDRRMGYAFVSERLTLQELLSVVASSDLFDRTEPAY
jgi:anti-sigma factor RsiW